MNTNDLSAHLIHPARLAALHAVALLDTSTEESFDRLTRLAARFVNAPVALVTLVDADRQFFKSSIGLPEPWCSRRETPLSHSFCQHNRTAGQPLIIEDARKNLFFNENLAIRDLNVIAYLGIPLVTSDGYVLGSFCVIDIKPRQWNEEEVAIVQDLAGAVMTEIQLRTEISARHQTEGERDEFSELNKRLHKEMSARKQAEEQHEKLEVQLHQAQKMEAIGTLAGGIAHDFNNILAVILGFTEMAKDDCQPGSTISKDLDKVLEAGNRAKDLVKQILAFSREDDMERIPLQPASIVKEAIKMLRPSLPTTIKINQNIDPQTGLVFADPTQIHQILMNLCTNAFHAMEETGGELDISLKEVTLSREDLVHEPKVADGTFIQLSIGDSGPGITPSIKNKIFDPYFTTKAAGKGTGMGLSMVHGIVKSYGGFISFYSKLGEGTVFHVFLPVVEKDTVPENEIIDQIPIGRERILFVDDEEILAKMGKTILERLGYHVTVRNSSFEALETFQKQPDQFDLVITDQTMPGMTGSDLSRRMLQLRPDIPIILCTGYSTIISEGKAKSMGIKEFALKPLAKQDIAKLIRKVLDV